MTNRTSQNYLLRHLPEHVRAAILDVADYVQLDLRDNIFEPNKPIEHVDFPETGVMSLLTPVEDGTLVEIATIGNEGMLGVSVALGVMQVPEIAFCQVVGSAHRVPTTEFLRLLELHPSLKKLCFLYTAMLFELVARNTACNRSHTVDQRCARWLLMTSDRCGSREFVLTQEFLAFMLGVSRTGVSFAAGLLAKKGLISYVRGKVKIMDVSGLEQASCQCYAVMKRYSITPE